MQNEIPRELIAEIVARTDLIQVVSQTVVLKRVGGYMMGLCPFHPDKKSSSFGIRIGGHHFHCYGCHAAGDIITFMKLQTNRPFREIVEELASRCGVLLPEKPLTDAEKRAIEQRKTDQELMREAQNLFAEWLKAPNAAHAKQVALQRGYTDDEISAEGLGFSGEGWEELVGAFNKRGHDLKRAIELGLCSERKSGGYFDRFRNRLTFPICDAQGGVIAFGGRALTADEPAKYLNSPESPLYRKSHNLFRIDKAKDGARKHGIIVLTEGYFDALSFVAAGVPNVVASCGTAFTPEQAKLIRRYCGHVVTAFDGDRAGLKATVAAFPLLAALGIRHDVVLLPADEDPDSLRQKKGNAALQTHLRNAVPILDFLLERLVTHGRKSIAAKTAAIQRMAGYVQHLQSPVEQELYRQKAAEAFGITVGLMQETKHRSAPAVAAAAKAAAPVVRKAAAPNRKISEEELLVGLMLHAPEIIPRVAQSAAPALFADEGLRRLAAQLAEDFERYQSVLLDDVLERFPDVPVADLKVRASRYLAPDGGTEIIDPEVLANSIQDCLRGVQRLHMMREKEKLIEDLQNAKGSGNKAEEDRIMGSLQAILRLQNDNP